MFTGWVKSLVAAIFPREGSENLGQGSSAFEKKAKASLIDVTNGVSLTEEARKKSMELLSLVKKGGGHLDRLGFWIRARRKVKGGLEDFYDMPEIMDEITEKIVDVAEHDPFYKKLFG